MDATLNHASKLLVQERKRLFRPVLLPGQVLLQWCFLEMECNRNACRLVFRIFEYVIWFCWVFTERVHCMESAQMRSYIWSVLSCTHIQSEYRKIRTRNNSLFGHFSRTGGIIDYWYSVIIDYLNAFGHLLDFWRAVSHSVFAKDEAVFGFLAKRWSCMKF